MWLTIIWYIARNYGIYILLFLAGLYCYHRINKWWNGPTDNSFTISAEVVDIQTSNQYTIKAGLFGKRTRLVTLYGVAIAEESPALNLVSSHLKSGDTISIDVESGGRRVNDIVGVVLAPNGTNLNLALLENGFAKTTCKDKDFVAAEKKAKDLRIGIWKENNRPRPHWWKDE